MVYGRPYGQRRWPRIAGAAAALVVVLVGGVVIGYWVLPRHDAAAAAAASDGGNSATVAGPNSIVDGVATGYPHTVAGAQAAAWNDVMAIVDGRETGVVGKSAVDQHLLASNITSSGRKYVDIYGGGRRTKAFQLAVFSSTAVAYNPAQTSIKVWTYENPYGAPINVSPPQDQPVNWMTRTLVLVWRGDDWKVQDWTEKRGPTLADTDSSSLPGNPPAYVTTVTK